MKIGEAEQMLQERGGNFWKWKEWMNIWTREEELNINNLVDFEFKFVILEKNKIKKWESGNNNIVNFTGLINEFQTSFHGRYNKYEYDYNQNTGELSIYCNWRK